jgi:hypothetical protein
MIGYLFDVPSFFYKFFL